jgi:hypothetical protein
MKMVGSMSGNQLEILESGAYAMRVGDGIKTWTALGDNVYLHIPNTKAGEKDVR